MDTPMTTHLARGRAAGFTLVELMIAMVLGLIVIGAVLALSLSMIRGNSDTIVATRLTQELRAAAAAITSELQRAGGVANPFDLAAANAISDVDDSVNNCIKYSYSYYEGSTLVTIDQAISKSGDTIYVGTACGGGTPLSSSTVTITDLDFERDGRAISVTLRGKLTLSKGEEVQRTYTQTVFAPGLMLASGT